MSAGLSADHAPPLDIPFRFLALSVAGFALLALTYPWQMRLLLGGIYDHHLTAFVHINTLGVVAASIMGASYQLLPVVLDAPLGSARLARLSWWCYLPGEIAFASGLAFGRLTLVAAGSTLVYAALALYVAVVLRTLAQERRNGVTTWHVAASLVGLVYAATAGLLLALSKSTGFLGGLTLPLLAAHATLILGAWVAPLHMGIAYRLVGMFLLSEDHVHGGLARAALVATVAGAWSLAVDVLFGLGGGLRLAATAALLLGQVLFAAQLIRLYRYRRRRTFDVHLPFAAASAGYVVLAAGLLTFGAATGRPASDPLWVAAGWWAIAGWAQTAIQGFFYKIATFLTWLHRYAPLAGRQRVPKLEDLYSRRLALAGCGCWLVGVFAAGLAALTGLPRLADAAGLTLSLGGGAFVLNALRIGAHWRAPANGAAAPLAPGARAVSRD